MRYRTVWISDTHLGSRGCRAAELSRFLKHMRCDRLYLVGDIIDMWRLRQRWYWPGEHNDVIRRLLNQARHDCEVIFLPGNHDEAVRPFVNVNFGGIQTLPYAIHVTATGRKMLVIHGDQFDLIVKHSRMISMLGGKAYDGLVVFNRYYNMVRIALGFQYFSLSKSIKLKVKSACTFISRFEEALMHEATRRGLDGVICGHIHQAQAHETGPVHYYNCGDWVESCTALVEHFDGRLEILEHLDEMDEPHSEAELEPIGSQLFDPFVSANVDPFDVERMEKEHLTFGQT